MPRIEMKLAEAELMDDGCLEIAEDIGDPSECKVWLYPEDVQLLRAFLNEHAAKE